jgi:hypothetical protein
MLSKYIEMYNNMIEFQKVQNNFNLIGKNSKIIDFHMLNSSNHLNKIHKLSKFDCNFRTIK